ncbi:winged helix-turn-helix domain-containing protein [Nocardioides sp. HDW12B]|uniref:winged helix-turn-helix domain-containing protein n=1 Tax=Nocardioides sp. HDW12B TaxID=2714939 RepID=UPI00140911F5|nr:crosslink repair DNA glycosylase YcaQ family protein [Nocardioides sp. HDW12B]QIK65590.1 winged helix-turn-helix domain-containing protein [Nocardioides sp. HDW12B]
MARPEHLTRAQARRIALAAQGFLDPRHATPSLRTLSRTVARTGVLQVDSVNVLQRAHHMPLFSRMGPYDTGLLTRAAEQRPRRLVEYWAHVQALMPVDLWPVMRHRMEEYRAQRGKWGMGADEGLVARLVAEIRAGGPATARDLDDGAPRSTEHWGWNWSAARKALDFAFLTGDLAVAGRTSSFEVVYDVPERVLPAAVLDAPTPTRDEADRELVRRAARSHGVASARCLADYYRMRQVPGPGTRGAQGAVADLVEDGELVPVRVEGWARPAYLHRDARLPRRVAARTVLSPFDPVVWERDRTEALFGFRYRIEIYVPAAQRVHGYYVLPFLLGDRLVARVDLKADRPRRTLLVQAAYAEEGAPPDTAEELLAALGELAGWLGLDRVVTRPRGGLGEVLARALPDLT